MSETLIRGDLESILAELTRDVSPGIVARIAQLRNDPGVQDRLDDLADRCNEGLLSEAERLEYRDFVEAIDILALARLRANAPR